MWSPFLFIVLANRSRSEPLKSPEKAIPAVGLPQRRRPDERRVGPLPAPGYLHHAEVSFDLEDVDSSSYRVECGVERCVPASLLVTRRGRVRRVAAGGQCQRQDDDDQSPFAHEPEGCHSKRSQSTTLASANFSHVEDRSARLTS
jgi:hypothetical protein